MHYSFYIFLFFALWFTMVNILRACKGLNVSAINFVIMAATIVGCVVGS